MRIILIALIIVLVFTAGCLKLNSTKSQTGKDQQSGTAGMAQNPGGLPELQSGGQSGSLSGINPPSSPQVGGQSGSAPLSQSGSTSSQPSASSSKMGELQGLQGSGQSGSLPSLQGSSQSGNIGGFNQPGSSNIPAGTPVSQGMAGFKKPYPYDPNNLGVKAIRADKKVINPGEAVFLLCDIENATSIIITDGEGRKFDVPVTKRGLFVTPMKTTAYTVTASNTAGSITESVTVIVEFMDVGLYKGGKLQHEFTTFQTLRYKIKPGETTWLFWNTRSAGDVYIWDSLNGRGTIDALEEWAQKEKMDERFREPLWGEREIKPPAQVTFIGTCVNRDVYIQVPSWVLIEQ